MNTIEHIHQRWQAPLQLNGPSIRPAADSQVGISESFQAVIKAVDAQQHHASRAVAAVDRGDSDDLAGAMIRSQTASVSFSALLQVRNKLSSAFDDVLRMPL